jgi:hypothetical protein
MNFKLTEEQRQLQETVRRMVSGERPHQQLRAVIDGKAAWDEGLWRDLQAFGLTMLLVPEADGGAGLTMVELALIAEVLGYAGAAVPFLGHTLATLALVKGGDEEQKARWLAALAAGEVIGSVALPDAADGWAPAEWSLAGQGARLTGRKINVPHGQLADIMIVGLAGGGLGVVDCKSEGMTVRAMDSLDLTRPLAAVEFSDAPVTVLANGVAAAEDVSNAALVLLAADAFGGKRSARPSRSSRESSTSLRTWRWKSSQPGGCIGSRPTRSNTGRTGWRRWAPWPRPTPPKCFCRAPAWVPNCMAASGSPGNMTPTSGSSARCSTTRGAGAQSDSWSVRLILPDGDVEPAAGSGAPPRSGDFARPHHDAVG